MQNQRDCHPGRRPPSLLGGCAVMRAGADRRRGPRQGRRHDEGVVQGARASRSSTASTRTRRRPRAARSAPARISPKDVAEEDRERQPGVDQVAGRRQVPRRLARAARRSRSAAPASSTPTPRRRRSAATATRATSSTKAGDLLRHHRPVACTTSARSAATARRCALRVRARCGTRRPTPPARTCRASATWAS